MSAPVRHAAALHPRAHTCRRLAQRCQPRCPAWVWDRAARRTGAAQRRAGREGRWRGRGGDAGRHLPLTVGTRPPRSEDARGALGPEESLLETQPPPSGKGELASPGSRSPLSFAPELTTQPAKAEGLEPRVHLKVARAPGGARVMRHKSRCAGGAAGAGGRGEGNGRGMFLLLPLPCLPHLTR